MLIVLGMILSHDEFGLFNVITALLSYSILIVGLDLYVVTTRKFANDELPERKEIIKCHYLITLTAFLLFLPVCTFFLNFYGISNYRYIILSLALLEYVNQDLYRVLVAAERYAVASMGLMLRSAAWVWVIFIFFAANKQVINLETVLYTWLLFDILAFLHSGFSLYRIISGCEGARKSNVWMTYILNAKKIAGYWFSTIGFKFTSVADKLVIPLVSSVSDVGPYGLAFSIGSMGGVVYEAIKLDANYSRWAKILNDINSEYKKKRELIRSEMIKALVLGLVYGVTVFFGLVFAKKFIVQKSNFDIPFYVIIESSLFASLVIPHQAFTFINYLSENDKTVLVGNYMGFLVFGLVLIAAYMQDSLVGIGCAPLLSVLLMTYIKGKLLIRSMQNYD